MRSWPSCGRSAVPGRLDNLELKYSTASEMPFKRMKVRLKKEIVTLGDPQTDPLRRVGTYVSPDEWNRLMEEPGIVLLDTRNDFEVGDGHLRRARSIRRIERFSEFKDFVATKLDPARAQARSPCSAPAASAARRPAPTC